jgi:hypothetical protein
MPAQTANLFLLQDLQDSSRTGQLADSDRGALQPVAGWIKTFDDVLQQLAVPSYADDGILFGPYYEGNEQTAIHNSRFRPFQSPMPFLFVRPGVISDSEFFVDNEEWLYLWARRYGESAVQTLLRNYAAPTGGSSTSDAAPRG